MKQPANPAVRAVSVLAALLLLLVACSPAQPQESSSASSISSSSVSSSASASQSSSSAELVLPVKGEHKQLLFEGVGFRAYEMWDGYIVLSQDEDGGNSWYLTFFNKNGEKQWDRPSSAEFILTDNFAVYRTSEKKLVALDQSGNTVWTLPLSLDTKQLSVMIPNESGGLYVFFSEYNEPKLNTVAIVSKTGELSESMPINGFEGSGIEIMDAFKGRDGDIYLVGAQQQTDTRFIARFDKDLNFRDCFYTEPKQYGNAEIDMDNGRIYYLGQDYEQGYGDSMRGMFYALDLHCNILTENIYEEGQPCSAAFLANGYTLVSLFSFDDTKLLEQEVDIYDSNWNLVDTFNSGVGWPEFYPTGDGGFLIKGQSLVEGAAIESLKGPGMPRLDTVVAKYSADFEAEWQERYFVKDGKSGYDYFVYIDKNFNVFTE